MTTSPHAHWTINGVVSIGAVLVGGLWLLAPSRYPFGPDSAVQAGINAVMPAQVGGWLLVALGALGLGTALAGLRGHRVGLAVATQVAGYVIVFCDASLLSSAGYLLAIPLPYIVVGLVVAAGVRHRRLGATLLTCGVLGLALAAGTGALAEGVSSYLSYLSSFVASLGTFAVTIAWAWIMALAAVSWVWTALRLLRPQLAVERRLPWMLPPLVNRWGRIATIIASLGAVPFGLLRLTWLTPWPMGGGQGDLMMDDLDPTTRIQGALFALPCAVSVLLVLGLTQRWGEVAPRWLPGIGGRELPVGFAVIPGAVAATILTVAAPGIAVMPLASGAPLAEVLIWWLVFPLPVWGPALAAAVLAYWLRRTAPPENGDVPHAGEPIHHLRGSAAVPAFLASIP